MTDKPNAERPRMNKITAETVAAFEANANRLVRRMHARIYHALDIAETERNRNDIRFLVSDFRNDLPEK